MFVPHTELVPSGYCATCPTKELVDGLSKRLYALPEAQLRELMDMFEVEYVNRQAARAGFLESEMQYV